MRSGWGRVWLLLAKRQHSKILRVLEPGARERHPCKASISHRGRGGHYAVTGEGSRHWGDDIHSPRCLVDVP